MFYQIKLNGHGVLDLGRVVDEPGVASRHQDAVADHRNVPELGEVGRVDGIPTQDRIFGSGEHPPHQLHRREDVGQRAQEVDPLLVPPELTKHLQEVVERCRDSIPVPGRRLEPDFFAGIVVVHPLTDKKKQAQTCPNRFYGGNAIQAHLYLCIVNSIDTIIRSRLIQTSQTGIDSLSNWFYLQARS